MLTRICDEFNIQYPNTNTTPFPLKILVDEIKNYLCKSHGNHRKAVLNVVLPVLVEYMSFFNNEGGEDSEIAEEMEFVFSQISADSVEQLIKALNNAIKGDSVARGKTEIIRRAITGALGEIGDKKSIQALLKTLELEVLGEGYVTAKNCVYSLSVFEDARAANAIVATLQHSDGDVERVARNMLRHHLVYGSFKKESVRREAVNSMIGLLKSKNENVVMNAIWVLADICETKAVPFFEKIITNTQELRPGLVKYVQEALTKIQTGRISIEEEI